MVVLNSALTFFYRKLLLNVIEQFLNNCKYEYIQFPDNSKLSCDWASQPFVGSSTKDCRMNQNGFTDDCTNGY